jgi:hypothetical protein
VDALGKTDYGLQSIQKILHAPMCSLHEAAGSRILPNERFIRLKVLQEQRVLLEQLALRPCSMTSRKSPNRSYRNRHP